MSNLTQSTDTSCLKTNSCETVNSEKNICKKRKLIESLKSNRFESLKGSEFLIQKIKNQREVMNKRESDSTETEKLILKQQHVIQKLNQENKILIDQNDQLNVELESNYSEILLIQSENEQLKQQNENLRNQLTVSQSYSVNMLQELKSSQKTLISISRKISKFQN